MITCCRRCRRDLQTGEARYEFCAECYDILFPSGSSLMFSEDAYKLFGGIVESSRVVKYEGTKRYFRAHPEKLREYKKRYFDKYPDKKKAKLEQVKRWVDAFRREHPEEYKRRSREYSRRRYAKMKNRMSLDPVYAAKVRRIRHKRYLHRTDAM